MKPHGALWLLFLFSQLLVGTSPGVADRAGTAPREIMIRVDGASCPFCAFGLEKRLGRIEGVTGVRIEMKEGKAIVTVKQGATISKQALRQAIEEAGFTPREIIAPPEVFSKDAAP